MQINHLEQQHTIYATEYITSKEYNELEQLQELCFQNDHTNLKLELGYKLYIGNLAATDLTTKSMLNNSKLNEFLYYIDGTLVAYLGISCFGGNIGEINGMTHPDWRGKGIFHKLFDLMTQECQKRNFAKVLLLTDGKSESGLAFIKSVGGVYDSSEYRMKLAQYPNFSDNSCVTLRTARIRDKSIIGKLNADFFGDQVEDSDDNDKDNILDRNDKEEISKRENMDAELTGAPNTTVYMIETEETVIGKIHIEYGDQTAFICGFGILSDYRRKGYGKAALMESLRILSQKGIQVVGLDVLCTNSKALNLYIGCGFEQVSIMDYYRYPIQ